MKSLLAKLLEVTLEDKIYIVITLILVGSTFLYVLTTHAHFDAKARFVAREGLEAFNDDEAPVLTFPREEIEELNDVGAASVGVDPAGDERLFCFKVEDKVVTELRFVDSVSKSKDTAVSGSCSPTFTPTAFDGFVHTQPGFNDELSKEDKDVEADIDWTCIMYDQVVQLQEEVGGLQCWKVVNTPDGHGFKPVEIGIS